MPCVQGGLLGMFLFHYSTNPVALFQAGISKDKVIPLYGRGNSDGKDPRWALIMFIVYRHHILSAHDLQTQGESAS